MTELSTSSSGDFLVSLRPFDTLIGWKVFFNWSFSKCLRLIEEGWHGTIRGRGNGNSLLDFKAICAYMDCAVVLQQVERLQQKFRR